MLQQINQWLAIGAHMPELQKVAVRVLLQLYNTFMTPVKLMPFNNNKMHKCICFGVVTHGLTSNS